MLNLGAAESEVAESVVAESGSCRIWNFEVAESVVAESKLLTFAKLLKRFLFNRNTAAGKLGSTATRRQRSESLPNWSQDDVEMQHPEKLIFATSPMRNASCCFSQGLPKRAKTHSKTTSYTSAFPTLKKQPPSFDFAPTWLPLGPPKAPPRGLQGLLKTTLGSILGHPS